MEGKTARAAGEILHVSPQFISEWGRRLLDRSIRTDTVDGRLVKVTRHTFKDDWQELIKSKKRGPEPGRCPVVDMIYEAVIEEKGKPFRENVGARKIGLMCGADPSSAVCIAVLTARSASCAGRTLPARPLPRP